MSARALERTKLVTGRGRWPIVRTAVVATTAVAALLALTFRGAPRSLQSPLVHAAAPTPGLSPGLPQPPPGLMDEHEPPHDVVAAAAPVASPEPEPQPQAKAQAPDEAPRLSARAQKRTRTPDPVTQGPSEVETPIASPSASPPSAAAPASPPPNEGHAVDLFSRRR
jgi:hypothetical protein